MLKIFTSFLVLPVITLLAASCLSGCNNKNDTTENDTDFNMPDLHGLIDTNDAKKTYYFVSKMLDTLQTDTFYQSILLNLLEQDSLDLTLQHLGYYTSLRGSSAAPTAFIDIIWGNYYNLTGKFDSSIVWFLKSVDHYHMTGNAKEYANCAGRLAEAYCYAGNFPMSTEWFLTALKEYEKLNDTINCYNTRAYLGYNALFIGENRKSIQIFSKVIPYYITLGDTQAIAITNLYMSNAYKGLGMVDSSMFYAHKAIDYYESLLLNASEKQKPDILQNLGMAYNNMHDRINTERITAKLLNIIQVGKIDPIIIRVHLSAVVMLMGNHRFNDAENICLNLLHYCDSTGDDYYLKYIYYFLSSLKYSQKEYLEAFIYSEHYHSIIDSMMTLEKTRIISELTTKYETEKKEEEIKLLNKQKQVEETRRIMFMFLTVITAIFSIITVLFLIIRNRKRKQLYSMNEALKMSEINALQKQLSHDRHKLDDFKENILAKNKMIDDLQVKLSELSNNPFSVLDSKQQEYLHHLCSLKILTDNDWSEFKKYYDKVFPGHLNNLQLSIPELTTAELRLFIMIKLNIDIKDIAEMLGISVESVRKT
ncbi:MAG: hypothetical protein ABIJ16_02075, partial [Bacteroidota bacterium]